MNINKSMLIKYLRHNKHNGRGVLRFGTLKGSYPRVVLANREIENLSVEDATRLWIEEIATTVEGLPTIYDVCKIQSEWI